MQNTRSRQYQLFKLLANEAAYKPASYYKNLLSVSLKTIYNDLEALSEMMGPYELSIHKVPRHGMKLVGERMNMEAFQREWMNGKEEPATMYSPAVRRMWIMQKVMLEECDPSLEEMEQTFYVTSASLRSDLAYLQELLRAFHVSIYTAKGKIYIRGSEAAMQKAYKALLMEMGKRDPCDTMIDHDPMEDVIAELFQKNVLVILPSTWCAISLI